MLDQSLTKTVAFGTMCSLCMKSFHNFDLHFSIRGINTTNCTLIQFFFLIYQQQEEMSEQQIRIGLVEKKLENRNREAEDDLKKVQRKLDDSALQLKKKEK